VETLYTSPKLGGRGACHRKEYVEEVLGTPRPRRFAGAAGKLAWRGAEGALDRAERHQVTIRHASLCGNNRVVFNIGGNTYRLVVEMRYRAGIVWVKFAGTHAQYDEIDVETINDY
jgi:hypothetical protein